MRLIVGLGNPGEKYEKTRHNLGFLTLDTILEKLERVEKTFWDENKDLRSKIKDLRSNNHKVMLVKPTTFINDSGLAVSKVLSYYKITPEEMIVIHDDLDLPFGKIRVRFGGGAGGHHGVESIIEQIKTDKFLRIRLGIGDPRKVEGSKFKAQNSHHMEDYVLSPFQSKDRGKVKTMLKETIRIIEQIREHGIEKYMGKYNK